MNAVASPYPPAAADFPRLADSLILLLPFGEFPSGDCIFVIDAPAVDSIVGRFNAAAAGVAFAGLLVDFDAGSRDLDRPSTAAGWIVEMKLAAAGVLAKIRFTRSGRPDVASGNYQSICAFPADVAPLAGSRVRVLEIANASLANKLRAGAITLVPLSAAQNNAENKSQASQLTAAYMVKNRCGFDRAWNAVRVKHPHAFGLSPSRKQPSLPSIPLQAAAVNGSAADAFLRFKVRNRGCTTGQAWHAVRTTHPEMCATAPSAISRAISAYRVKNRAASFETAWNALRKEQPALFATP